MTTREDIHTKLHAASRLLEEAHGALFERNVNERSLTHWLAVILGPMFPGWDVDCEYNRDELETKRIVIASEVPNEVPSDDLHAETVFPDIIVHHRGTDENLLVIEAKKSNNPRGDQRDRCKLRGYLSVDEGGLGYEFGALVTFHVEDSEPRTELEIWPQYPPA